MCLRSWRKNKSCNFEGRLTRDEATADCVLFQYLTVLGVFSSPRLHDHNSSADTNITSIRNLPDKAA